MRQQENIVHWQTNNKNKISYTNVYYVPRLYYKAIYKKAEMTLP